MRSLWKSLGWVLAAVAPLAFVWGLSHPRHHPLQSPPHRAPVAARTTPKPAAPAPEASRDPLTLTGEVVDDSGRAVPGAAVTLLDPEGRGDVVLAGRSRELKDRETRTDDRGKFRFDDLRPGRRLLIARPEGRPPAWSDAFVLDQSRHQVLRLPAPVTLTGLTQPRAKLTFTCRLPGVPHSGHRPVTVEVTADEAGGYKAEGLPPSVPFAALVEAPGYRGRTFGPYQFPPGRQILDFDLDTGLTLRGTVRDGAGRPVQGARVSYDAAVAVTEADGSFALAGLEERSTTLIVAREGYIQTVISAVRPGSVDVRLPRAAEVTGKVMGGRGRYLCFSVGDARYRMGLGDSDAFHLPSVPPGTLRLDVEDDERRVLGSAVVDAPEGGSVEGVEIQVR